VRRGRVVKSEPGIDRGEVIILAERVEGDPETEALGQRNLLLDRFAGCTSSPMCRVSRFSLKYSGSRCRRFEVA
jgi:hypothetical protein